MTGEYEPATKIEIVERGADGKLTAKSLGTEITDPIVAALAKTSENALDSGTATGGTTTTLKDTAKNWKTNIWQYALIEITGGTSQGDIMVITSNTSDTITISGTFTSAPDSTSTYKVFGLSKTDIQNPTDISDPIVDAVEDYGWTLDLGMATSGTTTTMTNSSRNWDTDIWKYGVLVITDGTGSGQIREIASNTSDTITVSNAFTVTPDSTSTYKILVSPTRKVVIAASNIKVPIDMQAGMKTSMGSSTTPLAATKDYTGTKMDVSIYGAIVGTAYSDQDGTVYVDYSRDKANWYYSEPTALTGGTAVKFTSEVCAKYARIRYVNGASDQTVFDIEGLARVGV